MSHINHDTASRLLGITPGDLDALVKSGAVRRVDKNAYALPVLIQDYIGHLKSERDRAEYAPRQALIAEHLDVSERSVREFLADAGIEHKQATLTEIRVAYIRHLREVAAGRATAEGGLDLATERAGLARAQREKIEMQNAVTRGELAPRALLTQVLAAVAPRVCGLLESIVPALRRRSGYSAEDLDFVARTIADARNAIADLRLPDLLADVAEDDADDPSDTEDAA